MIIANLIYILQSENYLPKRFLGYVYKHLAWWRLQKRQKIVWTKKATLIYALTIILFLGILVVGVWLTRWWAVIMVLFLMILLPWLALLALIIVSPIDYWLKQRIFGKAKKIIGQKKVIKIGITGSYGKTSAKEILAGMLSEKYKVLKTPENINTEIGVAQFIIDKLKDEEILIVEMGAYKKGEIKSICQIVAPDYSILTGINEAHLERFGSLENTIQAKFELPVATKKISYLNFDDARVADNYKNFKINQAVGVESNKLISEVKIKPDFQGLEFKLFGVEMDCRLLAEHNLSLIALAGQLAKELGLTAEEIKRAVVKIEYAPHRLQPIRNSQIDVWVIDDSYNANLAGVMSGIEVLNRAKGRKIVLTPGPLVELGDKMKEIHKQIGELYAQKVDLVLLIKSKETEAVLEALKGQGFINYKIYNSTSEAHGDLKNILQKGDTILFQNDWPDVYF
ncbi:UDP-N-acetylmuramoyl-tripeptide--D-alanyl-D-alanine ligase [Candidatus Kuenenbacteria bacterium]|nr:UDP-N-acetylmuramoyl-tripeptide--D-alanyl-D-alanine ligase [Candidatus Kuenenbacteria bacterium]